MNFNSNILGGLDSVTPPDAFSSCFISVHAHMHALKFVPIETNLPVRACTTRHACMNYTVCMHYTTRIALQSW
jgi:hypothetical protein